MQPRPDGHAGHDQLLVAAHAAGDAAGADLARAAALVASCPDCASLHRDLRAVATALATAPAPSRPRDFRLSPADAARLAAPSGWRRLLAPLSGAGPVAASLAALGVAGVLLSGTLGAGILGGAASAPADRAPAAGGEASGVGAAAAPTGTPIVKGDMSMTNTSGGGVESMPSPAGQEGQPPRAPAGTAAPVDGASPAPSLAPDIAATAAPGAASSTVPSAAPGSAGPGSAAPTPTPLTPIDRPHAIEIARQARPDYAKEQVLGVYLDRYGTLGNSYAAPQGPTPGPDDLVWLVNLGWVEGPLNGQGAFVLIDATDGHVIKTWNWIS